jgi:hypothetical protein
VPNESNDFPQLRIGLMWFGFERRHFQGPPQGLIIREGEATIRAAEQAVGETG